jgi:hypothetical protein
MVACASTRLPGNEIAPLGEVEDGGDQGAGALAAFSEREGVPTVATLLTERVDQLQESRPGEHLRLPAIAGPLSLAGELGASRHQLRHVSAPVQPCASSRPQGDGFGQRLPNSRFLRDRETPYSHSIVAGGLPEMS